MKSNLRDRFRDFLASEEGRVGAKTPLTLGVTAGSLLVGQSMLTPTADAHFNCNPGGCPDEQVCLFWCDDWSPFAGCLGEWHSDCVDH